MTTFVISLIRSNAAPLVGAFATWLVSLGLVVPEEARVGLTAFLFFFLSGIYYLVVRLIEQKFPAVGILLGYAKSPDSYSKGSGVEYVQSAPTVSNPAHLAEADIQDLAERNARHSL